jgi:hypothetical protein
MRELDAVDVRFGGARLVVHAEVGHSRVPRIAAELATKVGFVNQRSEPTRVERGVMRTRSGGRVVLGADRGAPLELRVGLERMEQVSRAER